MASKLPTLAGAMTPFPHSIARDASIEDALAMMEDHAIHHLPVTHAEAIVGVIAKTDVVLARTLGVRGAAPPSVGAVCGDKRPMVVDIHTRLELVVARMARDHVDSVIVTRHARLAGILTHTDVCRAFAELLSVLAPPPGEDEAAE